MGYHFTKYFVALIIMVEYWWIEYWISANNQAALSTSSTHFKLAI
jgi:hypothetical protein